MGNYQKAKGRNFNDRFVSLPYYMLNCSAYKALSFPARAAYVEFKKRYNGNNNGSIGFSVRDLAKQLGCAPNTAAKALECLIEKGFILCSQKSGFNVKHRIASSFILTEYEHNKKTPTKDFMRWEKK